MDASASGGPPLRVGGPDNVQIRAGGRVAFWLASAAWTVLVFVLRAAETEAGASVPRIGLIGYLAGLACIYLLAGVNVVSEWKRRPIMLFGRYVKTIGPGLAWVDPVFHRRLDDVAVRDVVSELRIGGVQTHDNVPISFNLIMTTRVDDGKVRDFVVQVANGYEATRQRALASVTEIVGNHELDAILHNRDKFYAEVRDSLQGKVADWGVKVRAVELKDLQITDEKIQQAIAMKARAGKEADAELVRAAMQLNIAAKLVAAAAVLTPDAWRLKELEVLVELTRSAQNNTILIPTTLLRGLEDISGWRRQAAEVPEPTP
ncbi:MAG TPA: SPFH domain-containing protein [Thermoanaerobaculia bacterium]|nr:SPFH domain-containing protein [Thermoanaerobaculia bacterium]